MGQPGSCPSRDIAIISAAWPPGDPGQPSQLADHPTTTSDPPSVRSQRPSLIVKLPVMEPFPFMRLPLEIRTMIYKECLIMPVPIQIYGHGNAMISRDRRSPQWSNPICATALCRLFQVSKAIYRESMPIYFRYNEFSFSSLSPVYYFLHSLAPDARRTISSISLTYGGTREALAARALRTCLGLRHLTIVFDSWSMASARPTSGPCSLLHLNGLRDLLRIRGLQTLEVHRKLDHYPDSHGSFRDFPAFVEALQVLKRPRAKAQFTRQDKKDYPQKATRTVLGRANVRTRMERKAALADAL
ncbi:MAG: hypothetical protein Q9163_005779 [Psora crenata]